VERGWSGIKRSQKSETLRYLLAADHRLRQNGTCRNNVAPSGKLRTPYSGYRSILHISGSRPTGCEGSYTNRRLSRKEMTIAPPQHKVLHNKVNERITTMSSWRKETWTRRNLLKSLSIDTLNSRKANNREDTSQKRGAGSLTSMHSPTVMEKKR